MTHPFECIPAATRRILYWATLLSTLAVATALGIMAEGFTSQTGEDGTSYDILAFEFAHYPGNARLILDTWGEEGIAAAKRQTILDYLFLLLYPNAIALGILAVVSGMAPGGWIPTIGRSLAWAQWLAGMLDATENAMLLKILHSGPGSPAPEIAFYCAAIKFAIVIGGLLYILLCLPLLWKPETPRLPADDVPTP
jgi:hypothetical protein